MLKLKFRKSKLKMKLIHLKIIYHFKVKFNLFFTVRISFNFENSNKNELKNSNKKDELDEKLKLSTKI